MPKLVNVVNPGNPSGTYIPEPLLKVRHSLLKIYHYNVDKLVMFKILSKPTVIYVLLLQQRISDLCRKAGSWLVVDNTYE